MMELPSYFSDFVRNIGPSASDRSEYQERHSELRERLRADERLNPAIVSTFLQGSYRRGTLVRPTENGHADVDVVVVTRLTQEEYSPDTAIREFLPFLEKHYEGQYERRARSVGISLSKVDLDLVVTSAPSESQIGILQSEAVMSSATPEDVVDWRLVPSWIPLADRTRQGAATLLRAAQAEEEWKLEPLYIPDREIKLWEPTHPLEQIRWTHEKNRLTNGHYIHVVKAIKWWRRNNQALPKYPKGYPVEHLIGICCPNSLTSIAAGVTATLEAIAAKYLLYAQARQTPFVPDHGVAEHDVFRRVNGEDFARFHQQICLAAKEARAALDADSVGSSAARWRQLFGNEFPSGPSDGDDSGGPGGPRGGFSPRREVTEIGGGRFA